MSLKKLSGMAVMVVLTILLSACNIGATPAPTQDVGLIYTQAAQLVATQFAMQQTQTALAIPPTPLPSPTAPVIATFSVAPFGVSTPPGGGIPFSTSTSLPFGAATLPGGFLPTATIRALATASGPECDRAIFTGNENYPDGTVMKPGNSFDKTWEIKNAGTCTWDDGYAFVYLGGTFGGYDIKIKNKGDFVAPGQTVNYTVHLNASLAPNTYQECWSMRNDKGKYFQDTPIACIKIIVKK